MVPFLTDPLFIVAAVVALGAGYMFFESRWIEVVEKTLTLERLPPSFDGFRIVMVSDFHSWGLGRYERRVIEQVGRIQADVLFILGDLKARNTTRNQPVIALLGALVKAAEGHPFQPVYVRGNHDRRGFDTLVGKRRDLCALRDRSIALQRRDGVMVVAGVRRTGRVTRRMRHSVRKALRNVDPNAFTILLSHNPDFLRMAARRGVDLVLSGDTHGGQICLPYVGGILPKTHLGRVFERGHAVGWGSQLYVTRGVGTTGPPFRLLCRPEITVLTLRRGEEASAEPEPRATRP
jgi:predicted MPP superfamily phosphohydrolase